MKTISRRNAILLRGSLLAAGLVSALLPAGAGCKKDSGGGGGASGTSVLSIGNVKAIGSVKVNGVRYDDTSATIVGDNAVKTIADARKIGVSVAVTGVRNPDGTTGVAERIEINNELRGSITAKGADTLTVLGQTVLVDGATVFANVSGFAALLVGDRVEVHGQRTGTGAILASRVEVVGPSDPDELRGQVAGKTGTSFNIGGFVIYYDVTTVIVPAGAVFADGDVVEVQLAGNVATLIEVENELEGASEVEIEGVVSGFTVHPGDFLVSGVPVRTTSSTEFQNGADVDLLNGMRIEVEGTMQAGVLIAEEIEFGDPIIIIANASGVSATQLTLLGKTILRTSRTSPDAAVIDGDGVEIRGFLNLNGSITALSVVNLGQPVQAGEEVLRGPVSAFNATAKTLTVLGITVDGSGPAATFQMNDGVLIDAAQFFSLLVANDTVVQAQGTFTLATSTMAASELEIE